MSGTRRGRDLLGAGAHGLLRRVAGLGSAVVAVGGGLALVWPPATLVVLAAALPGVALTYVLERLLPARSPLSLLLRYALAGGALGALAAALHVQGDSAGEVDVVIGAAGLVAGVAVGTVAAAVALSAATWRPASLAAVAAVSVTGCAALGTWGHLLTRPPAPHDFLLLEEPAAVADAYRAVDALADGVVVAFAERRKRGADVLAHEVWVQVAGAVVAPVEQSAWHARYADPVSTRHGLARLITVGVGDDRRCVVVTGQHTQRSAGTCDLDSLR